MNEFDALIEGMAKKDNASRGQKPWETLPNAYRENFRIDARMAVASIKALGFDIVNKEGEKI